MLPEGAILEGIFLYLGLPGLFSMAAVLYRPSWHDAAALLWLLTTVLYIRDFGTCYVVAGMIPTFGHVYGAIKYRKQNKVLRSEQ